MCRKFHTPLESAGFSPKNKLDLHSTLEIISRKRMTIPAVVQFRPWWGLWAFGFVGLERGKYCVSKKNLYVSNIKDAIFQKERTIFNHILSFNLVRGRAIDSSAVTCLSLSYFRCLITFLTLKSFGIYKQIEMDPDFRFQLISSCKQDMFFCVF